RGNARLLLLAWDLSVQGAAHNSWGVTRREITGIIDLLPDSSELTATLEQLGLCALLKGTSTYFSPPGIELATFQITSTTL
ncbi:hypothetical protein, partial [Klebsiella pneumoniae]|uniref:hypothetical protein n=1 Tax=Klebsiella pneumoniae TaxID=573 RepID=UPI0022B6F09E